MKKYLLYITAVFLISQLICCSTNIPKQKTVKDNNRNSDKTSTRPKPHDLNDIAESFIKQLTLGHELKGLMADNWSLVYHEDNREYGSTDGSLRNLSKYQIDLPIALEVYNDGKGWFEQKPSKRYKIQFDLKQQTSKWDRLIVSQFGDDLNSNTVYFSGYGESDYIKILCVKIKDKYYIKQLEYRSEDPG